MTSIVSLLGGLTLSGGVILYLLFNPEKIEKWSALSWQLLSQFDTVFKSAHKRYLKHDLQGRINEFVKVIAKDAPFLAGTRVNVEWVQDDVTRKSFLEGDVVILRLRRSDSEEKNFVHGAYMAVSTSLLFKCKRYISPSQRESLDLYVTMKLLEREKAVVVDKFLEDFLHPKTADPKSKVNQYMNSFAKIDAGKLFYQILLQELEFLGGKVFGGRQSAVIIGECNSLIEFLEEVAIRKIGEAGDLNFYGHYCRFAIVIVGKPTKLTPSGETYITYIRKQLIPSNPETLYILGLFENKRIIDTICSVFEKLYERYKDHRFKKILKYDQVLVEKKQYLVVLRRKGVGIFQASTS